MNKSLYILSLAAMALMGAAACDKVDSPNVDDIQSDAVAFRVGGPAFSAEVKTKTSVETAATLTSINVAAATGAAGTSDSQAWNSAFTKSGAVWTGGKYWPVENPDYHFYASNYPMAVRASGATVAASNTTDIVCAYLAAGDVGFKSTNTLAFEHIFARVGDVTVTAAAGYTLSGVSITLTPKTAGTYNLFTGAGRTDGTGWSATTSGSATGIAPVTAGTKSNDIYLVPGEYELTAAWTATRGDFSRTYSNKKKSVQIVGGKVNEILTTLGGEASEIELRITVAEWGENSIDVSFDM